MRVIHTGDLHFSTKQEKLYEVVQTTDFLLQQAATRYPDVIVLSGDTVDNYDGKIPADSDCFRAAKSFIRRAADIAPVIIVSGTNSHDRNISGLFDDIQARCPIHVATEIEQVALVDLGSKLQFCQYDPSWQGPTVAVFTLVPSVDKSNLAAMSPGSVRDGNLMMREVLHDLFSGLGLVNANLPGGIPRIFVTHGTVTGSVLSSGQQIVGEDLEFGVEDLLRANADVYCLGHIHKHQSFAGKIFYSGSPGRLNFGETEQKGFLIHEINEGKLTTAFIPTPARSFCFGEAAWDGNIETFEADVARVERECSGADVRFRYSVPEEDRHLIDRAALEQRFMAAGAVRVKIECQIIPKQRQRAAGISQAQTLPEKVARWGETVGVEIPGSVMAIAAVIEGHDVDEILAYIDGPETIEAAKAA